VENIIRILFTIGAILLWLFVKMKKSGDKQKSNKQIFESQDIIEQPKDILTQWNERIHKEKSAKKETQPALSSLEETTETYSPLETESAQDKKSEEEKEPEEKKKPTIITIAGMPLSPENIRHGIIFSEILKRRGKNL